MKENANEIRKDRRIGPGLLVEGLERRIALYVLAAGATIVAGASSACAQIVFTPNNTVLKGPFAQLNIDLDNDGNVDFLLSVANYAFPYCSSHAKCYFSTNAFAIRADNSLNGVVASNSTRFGRKIPAALAAGAKVDRRDQFVRLGYLACASKGFTDCPRVNFDETANRYIGVHFVDSNGETHAGWIGFRSVTQESDYIQATLLGWAYETQPNTPIIAGDWGGAAFPPSAEMRSAEPTSLELLAAGQVAVADWRRRSEQHFA